jgi:acetyl esterase/lipase
VQYRLAPLNKWPAMLDDVQTAVRFLRANADKYGLDPNRVAAAGASAGGHLSIFLGSIETRDPEPKEYREHSSKVQAVFNVFGPSDMTRDYAQGPGMDALFMAVIGKPRRDAAEEIKAASPLNFIDKNSAPMYILHGLQDPLVHPNQSRYVEARYKELGLPVVAVFIDGMAHNLPLENAEVRRGFENGIQFLLDHLSKRTILLEAIAR